MPIIKGQAHILTADGATKLGEGMCYIQTISPDRNGGTISRMSWSDPTPTLSETDTYRVMFVDTGRWLPIQFTRLGATSCGPVIARFRGVGRFSEASINPVVRPS